jgi:alkaline phosphatase D
VFFISGDRHLTKMAKVPREGRYALQELTCSPLTSGVRDPAKDEPNPHVIRETVVGVRNFCTINISGPAKDRVMTLRSHDSDGKALWERIISASELR